MASASALSTLFFTCCDEDSRGSDDDSSCFIYSGFHVSYSDSAADPNCVLGLLDAYAVRPVICCTIIDAFCSHEVCPPPSACLPLFVYLPPFSFILPFCDSRPLKCPLSCVVVWNWHLKHSNTADLPVKDALALISSLPFLDTVPHDNL